MAAIASRQPETPPIVTAVLLHAGCWAVLAGVAHAAPGLAFPWAWVEGAAAAALGPLLRLPLWWLVINLAFFPALTTALDAQIPSSWLLAAFLLLFLLQTGAWRRVPFFTSSVRTARRVAQLLPRHRGLRVIDLGCGTGSFLGALAHARPDLACQGVEIAPLPYWIACWRSWRSGGAFAVRWGDFWIADLSRYDVVYAYLSPQPMARLWQKARREMRPGALLVSNGFAVPGVEPWLTIDTGERLNPALHVWRM